MPFLRRRPLMRAAVVGGAAYHMGKRSQRNQQQDQDQEERLNALEEEKYYSEVSKPASSNGQKDLVEKLDELESMKSSGILTEAEFTKAKQKLLEG